MADQLLSSVKTMRNQKLQKSFAYSRLVNLLLPLAGIFVAFPFTFVLIFLHYPTFELRVLEQMLINIVAQLNRVAGIQPT